MRLSREAVRRVATVVAAIVGVVYIVWRLLFTMNTDALWFSVPVWVAEAFGVLVNLLTFYQVWDVSPRHPRRPAPEGLTVDVFVPTYNEPLWMVRRTLVGAVGIRHPHRTYLLDDGRRPEMRRLAEELGCGYITRGDNAGAKAGNLNHALGVTGGDVIAIFDADHVPMPEFLDATLGYFTDPKVAFVQTPQEFSNLDSFQHQGGSARRGSWHEQSMFYRVNQPGRDHYNAAFFCGSCGLMRRAALEEIGGFATETVTEDLHTSIKLHRRGWTSAYCNETLALGLAAQTAEPFHQQRLRWGQGTMQVMRRERFMTGRGLTLHQRINYLACAFHYVEGLQRLVFYGSPSVFLVTGVLPIRTPTLPFLVVMLAYYATGFVAFKLTGRGYARAFRGERFQMIRFFTYIRALAGLFVRRSLRFSVTDKSGRGRPATRVFAPSLLVTGSIVASIAGGFARLGLGHVQFPPAFAVNVAWAFWNLWIGVSATLVAVRAVEVRSIPRSSARLPVAWRTASASGIGVLEDLTEGGAGLRLLQPVEEQILDFTVLWPGIELEARGLVRRRGRDDHGMRLGLELAPVDDAAAVADAAARFDRLTFKSADAGRDLLGRLQPPHLRRLRPSRRRVTLPVSVGSDGRTWGVTHDISRGGVSVLLPQGVDPGDAVRVAVGDTPARWARVTWSRRLPADLGEAWMVGMRFTAPAAAALEGRTAAAQAA